MLDNNGNSFWRRFSKFLRSGDIFGVPITLNYDGKSSFKTVIGGIVSFMVYIIFAIIAAFLVRKMISKTSLNTNENNKVINLSVADSEMVYPMLNEFLFGFSIDTNMKEDMMSNIGYYLKDDYVYWDDDKGMNVFVSEIIDIVF